MKRVLAIALAGVLLISLFAGNLPQRVQAADPATTTQTMQLQSCDSADGFWTGGGVSGLQTEGAKEGTGYYANTNWENIICNNTFANKDLSAYADGQIRVWLYISNASVLAGDAAAQQMLYLKTGDGSTSFTWDLRGKLQTGWNDVILPFAEAASTGNIADVNTLQLVFYATDNIMVGIDDLRVEKQVQASADSGMIQSCDSADGFWTGGGVSGLQTEGAKEGTGYYANTNWENIICNNTFVKTDLSAYAGGQIRVWLYISNASVLAGDAAAQQMLYLKTGDGSTSFTWDLRGKLQTGWNDVILPFAEAASTGDISNVNTLQLVFYATDNVTVGIDGLRVEMASAEPPATEPPATEPPATEPPATEPPATEPPATEPPATEPPATEPPATEPPATEPVETYIEFTAIDKANSAEGWSGWMTYDFVTFPEISPALDSANKKEGAGSVSITSAAVATMSKVFEPMDLSAYKDAGYLHLWFYIDDASKLNTASIELTSSGDADQQEISWNLSGLVNGWNELYLPISESIKQGGDIDWTAVNYTRIVMNAGAEVTIAVDDISMCLYGNPKTGDAFPIEVLLPMLCLSAAALAAYIPYNRKRNSVR